MSALVGALTGSRRSLDRLSDFISQGHRVGVSTLVLYEWLRGPRTTAELRAQEDLFPRPEAVPFDAQAAGQAAALYALLPRARNREIDLAVAACALTRNAALWTLNAKDFEDVPGLEMM